MPELVKRYSAQDDGGNNVSPVEAPTDVLAQTRKLVHGLTSGVFANPSPADSDSDSDPQYRTTPRMFKHAVGRNHVDFRTGQQQDAAHYLGHLLETLERAEKRTSKHVVPSSELFAFRTITRTVCGADNKVRYDDGRELVWSVNIPTNKEEDNNTDDKEKGDDVAPDQKRFKQSDDETENKEKVPTVDLRACVDAWASPTTVDGTRWSHLGNAVHPAARTLRFSSFPPFLFLQLQRYYLGDDWVPRKIEVDVDVPEEIDLEALRSNGPSDGDDLVPEDAGNASSPADAVDKAALQQLAAMGFHENGCARALAAVGGSDVEAATNWIFEHHSDPDLNDPLPTTTSNTSSAAGPPVDEGVVASLTESLGCFAPDRIRKALQRCDGDAARAADWLFSHGEDEDPVDEDEGGDATPKPTFDGEGKYALVGMISHLGKQTGSGHYVCHLKKDGKWVIFNDEKVALSKSPPLRHAYIYLFQRKDCVGKTDPNF